MRALAAFMVLLAWQAAALAQPPYYLPSNPYYAQPAAVQSGISHFGWQPNGWRVSESKHFIVCHRDDAVAERVMRIAEKTRTKMIDKWFDDGPVVGWPGKCYIYVYGSADEYSWKTGTPALSPGHTSAKWEPNDASRLTSI